MPPAVGVATIEGSRQEHVNRADEDGVTVGGESPVLIAPANAPLHHMEVDVRIQAEAFKPSAEAVGGLLNKSPHWQRNCQPVRCGSANFGV